MTPPRPGYVHPLAAIGCPPEHRDWSPGDDMYYPDIAPTAQINAFVTVDAGRFRATVVGEHTFLMAHSHVAHDCLVGDDCELAAGTVLAGEVEVGDRVKFGVNSCVRPCIKIGALAVIGAGAVVVKDVPAHAVVVGNPARPIDWAGAEGDYDTWMAWFEARRT